MDSRTDSIRFESDGEDEITQSRISRSIIMIASNVIEVLRTKGYERSDIDMSFSEDPEELIRFKINGANVYRIFMEGSDGDSPFMIKGEWLNQHLNSPSIITRIKAYLSRLFGARAT